MSGRDKDENPESRDLLEKLEPANDISALFSSLHLDQTHYKPFTRRRGQVLNQPGEQAKDIPEREGYIQIGVFSPMGGSGKSTLAASLGSMLYLREKRVLLVDSSPWQTLAFHYGATELRSGMRSFFAPGVPASAVHIIGCTQDDAGVPDLSSTISTTPLDCILFDLGNLSGATLLAHLQRCDIALVPLLPDATAVRLAVTIKTLLEGLNPSPARVMFVLNQMDDSPLSKDIHHLLVQSLGELLFPSIIYRQPEIPQAMAQGIVLPSYAPEAQAVTVCDEIVRWIQLPEAGRIKIGQRWSER
jgi:cellulose biosynthesis protein BcsQ